MSKGRVSGDGRKTRRSPVKKKTTKKVASSAEPSSEASHAGDVHRFIGLSLGGGKADKACLAVIEYYPKHRKVFLSRLVEKIKSDEVHSADFKIQEIIEQYHGVVENLAFDVPFRFPRSLTEDDNSKSYEHSKEPHIKWMWDYTKKLHKKKKPRKLFTPYTQRCIEMYVSSELEEPFLLQHAMGANMAPLLARAMYLQKRMKIECIEVFPKLSIWRLGRSLNVMKSHLRFHKHSIGGDESRRAILQALSSQNVAFVYDQDVKLMIENNHAFEAFVCALTAFLEFKGQTEDRPAGFPEKEDWIAFPKLAIKWDTI